MKRPVKPGEFPDWERLYREEEVETMPWYHAGIDPDLEAALQDIGITSGTVLDIGTGPGTQALALAELGFRVTATDLSDSAVKKARTAARKRRIKVNFLLDDILRCALDTQFDLVLDRGCFHVLSPGLRRDYVKTVAGLVRPGGYLFVKCFSHKETVFQGGPCRFTPDDIRQIFGQRFIVESVKDTVFHGRLVPPPQALFCVMRKL